MAALFRRSLPTLSKVIHNIRVVPSRGVIDDDGTIEMPSTTVTMLNRDDDGDGIFIDAYSNLGFRLSTGMRVMGPSVFFPKSVLHWNVNDAAAINEDSLSLFTMLEPKIDLLVLGVGAKEDLAKINPNIIFYLRSKKINAEILTTEQALSTFNFLNSEKRYIAGAFIPPQNVTLGDDDADIFDFVQSHRDPFLLRKDFTDERPDEEISVLPEYGGPESELNLNNEDTHKKDTP